MLFTSFNFIVFFIVMVAIYWATMAKFRWIIVLVSSLVFYGVAVQWYTFVLLASITFNYYLGLYLQKIEGKQKKSWLIAGIILNLLFLASFKYFNTVSALIFSTLNPVSDNGSTFFRIIVPLGISFFTFSNISYLIEVSRRNIAAETHPGLFACYVSFFPKLIQGPIERPQNFLPQLHSNPEFDPSLASSGLRLMLWGFFKKLVIADRLALPVSQVYDHPDQATGPTLIIATLLYAVQIYMDFSAYTDIAIGSGRLLGFRLSPNFNRPYAATSIKDFWTRWHITLSNWLRDYVFLPFAYYLSRKLKKDTYAGIKTDKLLYSFSISLTFLICGIWHGVGWTFLAWGLLYAFYLVFAHFTAGMKKRFYKNTGIARNKWLHHSIQVVITFILVSFAWIFFRAANFHAVKILLSSVFTGWNISFANLHQLVGMVKIQGVSLVTIAVGVLFYLIAEVVEFKRSSVWKERFLKAPVLVRWSIYYLLIIVILVSGQFGTGSFVYFQF